MSDGGRGVRQETTPVTMFVGGVVVAASIALLALVRSGPVPVIGDRWLELTLFTVLVCVCELKPVTVARTGGIQEVVASATFAFAIFLTFGPVPAIAAQALASLIGDVVGKKPALKVVFNVAQYVLAWSMAGIVFHAIMGNETLGPGQSSRGGGGRLSSCRAPPISFATVPSSVRSSRSAPARRYGRVSPA